MTVIGIVVPSSPARAGTCSVPDAVVPGAALTGPTMNGACAAVEATAERTRQMTAWIARMLFGERGDDPLWIDPPHVGSPQIRDPHRTMAEPDGVAAGALELLDDLVGRDVDPGDRALNDVTHTEPSPTEISPPSPGMPHWIVATTLLLLASMRETLPSPWLIVQTDPSPVVRNRGFGPTSIDASMTLVRG